MHIRKRLRKLRRMFSWRDGAMLLVGVALTLGVIKLTHMRPATPTPLAYQRAGITASWIPPTVKHWDKPINTMAKKYDIDANLVAIIMTIESGGDPHAKSGADALGLMQVTPLTAQDIAARRLQKPLKTYDLKDPNTNIEFGVAYLAYLRNTFGDPRQGPDWNSTTELIAAGYNGGPGAASSLEKGNGLSDIQTVSYSRDVFNMWRERHASDSPTFDRWKARGGNDLLQAAQVSQSH